MIGNREIAEQRRLKRSTDAEDGVFCMLLVVEDHEKPPVCRTFIRTLLPLSLPLPHYDPLLFRNRRRDSLSCDLLHGAELGRTSFKTSAALYALILIDYVDQVLAAFNRIRRASLEASRTGLALGRIDIYEGASLNNLSISSRVKSAS